MMIIIITYALVSTGTAAVIIVITQQVIHHGSAGWEQAYSCVGTVFEYVDRAAREVELITGW